MKRSSFPAPRMTKAQNRLAFVQWLNGCSDTALANADANSLARSYGLPIQDVQQAITRQQFVRSTAA